MFQKLLQLLLILSITTLIYLGNTLLLNVSLLMLIVLTMINKNYYSFLSIIPLFFINPNAIIIFSVIYLILLFASLKVSKSVYRNLIFVLLTSVFVIYEITINNTDLKIGIYVLLIIFICIFINMFVERLSKQININNLS